MTLLLLTQIAMMLSVSALAFATGGFAAAQSALFGAAISLLNLIFLVFTWPRMLAKKQVALGVSAIVFKFALLGWILYLVTQSQTTSGAWLSVGLATVIPSVLVTAIFGSEIESRDGHGSTL